MFKLINNEDPFREHLDLLKLIPKEKKEELKQKTRDKVDDVISPGSDLGRIVHKVRKEIDREEEKKENRENAYKNLLHIGDEKKEFKLADHLFIRIGLITHHAIYIGADRVIHYSKNYDGEIEICKAELEEFSQGKTIQCLSESDSPLIYSRETAVRRAYHRMEEKRYALLGNNCEDFVRWCRSGGKEEIWEENFSF